jgi:O-antigen ligase
VDSVSKEVAPRGGRLLLTGLLSAWALGTAASEGLMQVAADATVLWALLLLLSGRARVEKGLRAPLFAGGLLALYQALSPLLVHLAGSKEWPSAGRWLQCLDTASAPALAVAAVVGVRWAAVDVAALVGWTGSVATGVVQHFVRWEAPLPSLLRLPVGRVHEVFAQEGQPRFAAGGFFFHRLRFAHGAVALLGPSLAAALRASSVRRRRLGALLVVLCALAIYLAFARAALGAALLLAVAAAAALTRGWARRAGFAGVLLLLLAVALAPGWRQRLSEASANLFNGERAQARAAGWDLVQRHPLLGVGFGNYHSAALARAEDTGLPPQLARDAHALWLTTWAETGFLGLLLWLAWQALLGLALFRRARTGAWPALGALLCWVAFHALAVVHHLPFHSSVHLTFALVWGMGLVRDAEAPQPSAAR